VRIQFIFKIFIHEAAALAERRLLSHIIKNDMMKQITTLRIRVACVVACLFGILVTASASFAQLRPNLGTASTYVVFTGGGAINNTGLSVLTGDVGQDGAYAFNGFPPGTYTGALNRNNSASALAKSDLLNAWTVEAAVTDEVEDVPGAATHCPLQVVPCVTF